MGAVNVRVTNKNGGARKGVRVGGAIGGVFGSMATNVRTDEDGHACLTWSSSASLEIIYIDGKAHKGKYRSGSTYAFQC